MGEKNAKNIIILNMLWSLLAVFVNYLMNFLITPYVTENIGVEAYGFVGLSATFISYMDIFTVGFNSFAGRFVSVAYHQGDYEKANRYYSSTILADFILSLLLLAAGTAMIIRLDQFFRIPSVLKQDVRLLFLLVLLRHLLTVLRTAFDTAAFIAERLDLAEKRQSAAYLLQGTVLLVMCLFLPPHVWYIGLANAVSAVYLLFAGWRLCRRLTPQLHFEKRWASRSAAWEIAATGLWTSLNNLGNVLNSGLDLLITNLMLSAAAVGEISIAKNLAAICYTLVVKISGSFRPRLLLYFAEGKTGRLVEMYRLAMKITGSFCGLVICVFYVCGYDFLRLWIPDQNIDFIFAASMIVLLGDIATGVVNPLYYVFTLTKRLKIPCLITILMGCANVVSMYLLIKGTSLGAYAVILTTMVINFVHFIDTPLYSAHCLGVPYGTFYPAIIRHAAAVAAGLAAAFGLRHLLPEASSWLELMGKAAAAGMVLMALFAVLMFSIPELRSLAERRSGR